MKRLRLDRVELLVGFIAYGVMFCNLHLDCDKKISQGVVSRNRSNPGNFESDKSFNSNLNVNLGSSSNF